MKEKPFSYDWAAYYQAAYEREKKKNTLLAGQIAEAEAKESDLSYSLNRIQNSIFWKVSMPVRKCYHAIKAGNLVHNTSANIRSDKRINDTNAEEYLEEYRREVFRQKHPYLQWIAEYEKDNVIDKNDNKCSDDFSAENDNVVSGWQKIELNDSDLCVILCGYGAINKRTCEIVKRWFNKIENNNCIFAYPDEDYYWETLSNRMCPWYKPCWSPDTMLSFCYVGHMIIIRKSLCGELLQEERYRKGTYEDFYDLCLRLEERAALNHNSIGHIEDVLFHNCYEPGQSASEQIAEAKQTGNDVLEIVEKMLKKELEQGHDMTGCSASFRAVRENALQRRGIKAHLEPGPHPDIYHVVYDVPERADGLEGSESGMVSVIIPSKDHPEVLERCLSSFQEKTDYTNYEWIVVDNGSNPDNRSRVEALRKEYGFRYLYEPMEFNFSAMCNLGAKQAKGEYLLLLNDDVEVIQKDWLRIMTGQAGQPHVGAVGAKLWYAESDAIQHAGITNLDIGPSHKLITFPDDRNYYYGHNQVTYNMIGVTAACLLIEKKKYWITGGMDESMEVAYNDVDLCFKLIESGFYNVLRNDAVLYHYESLSRGLDEEDDGKWERLLREKEALYAKHPKLSGADFFYHKNLIDNASDYKCNFKFDHEKHLKTTEVFVEDARKLAKTIKGGIQLTIDRAGRQQKIHRDEPDIIIITGWSYIPGEDNAKYSRNIILQQEDGTCYKAVPAPWSRWDVEAILSMEVNISLAGFVVRIKTEKLQSGNWKIGMIATDKNSKKQFFVWSDKEITIE